MKTYCLTLKRVFDVTLSLILIIILSPCMLFLAILIHLTSQGPIIFQQKRVGLGGREFNIYKFRTMVCNAEYLLSDFTPEQQLEFQSICKLKDDPRVTPLGRILRKTSLDELPQFLNVLRGEMSIVGPRPVTPEELNKFGEHADFLLSVKPGITGLSQISGRNNLPFEHRIQLDLKYIEACSIFLDFKIVFQTLPMVFSCQGAY